MIEYADYMDMDSIQLLQQALEQLPSSLLVWTISRRVGEKQPSDNGICTTLPQLAVAVKRVQRVLVGPMSLEDMERMLVETLKHSRIDPSVLMLLHAR